MDYQLIQTFADAFNRADNTDVGTSWDDSYTSWGPLQIVSNAVRAVTVGTGAMETVNSSGAGDDQYASVKLAAITGASNLAAILLRSTAGAAKNMYLFQARTDQTTRITKIVADVETELVNAGMIAWTAGDIAIGVVVGTTLAFYRNDTLIMSVVDSQFSTGRPGLAIFNATALVDVQFDDFAAGNAALAAPEKLRLVTAGGRWV